MYLLVFLQGMASPNEDRMQVALEELTDLKGVWTELAKIWEQIDDLKERPWISIQPRKVNLLPVSGVFLE